MAEEALQEMSFSAGLSRRLEEASEVLKGHEGRARLISHYDPDGITAAAIMAKTLLGLGIHFHITLAKKLDDRKLEKLGQSTMKEDLLIMTDMGSGKVSMLDELPCKVLVIDHHQPEKEGENIIHVNPHMFGIDGAREASASSFSLALATTVNPDNWKLAPLAIAGAVGDRQNLGGFRGYNEDLVTVANQKDIIKSERMPLLKGESPYESLIHYPEPYFMGITGRKREASRLIKWLDLEKESKYAELTDEQRHFLTSICTLRLLRQGATAEAVCEFVTTRYWLYDWDMYADDLSALLNACARQGDHGLGLALALGDKAAREKATEHSLKHREWIIENLRKLETTLPKALEHLQHFHTDKTTYTGVLAGLGTLYFFDNTKATIGITKKNGGSHVSARAPRHLVDHGLNLGLACKLAAEGLKGAGGGHDIAAGATVPSKNEGKFLKEMDRIIGEQLSGESSVE